VGDRLPPDLPKVDVPMLVIQGDDDQILPHPRPADGCPT
jgi:pimeloyl-ACP methyl ester carboxylesterase